jgi:undecaprenyl-diphosphatase
VFDIAIQTGAILAVIMVYWQKIRDTLVALPTQRQAQRLRLNVAIAFARPWCWACCLARRSRRTCSRPVVVASTFIIGRLHHPVGRAPGQPGGGPRILDVDDMTWPGRAEGGPGAVPGHDPGHQPQRRHHHRRHVAGPVAQGRHRFFFLPGHPHAHWRRRLQPVQGARLLSDGRPADVRRGPAVAAFLSAWLCIRWLLRYIATHSFVGFAWYRIAFGLQWCWLEHATYIGDREVTRTFQVSRLRLRLLDAQAGSAAQPRAVFEATSVYEGDNEDLADLVPYLVRAAFEGFPGANGRVRQVRFDPKTGAVIRP